MGEQGKKYMHWAPLSSGKYHCIKTTTVFLSLLKQWCMLANLCQFLGEKSVSMLFFWDLVMRFKTVLYPPKSCFKIFLCRHKFHLPQKRLDFWITCMQKQSDGFPAVHEHLFISNPKFFINIYKIFVVITRANLRKPGVLFFCVVFLLVTMIVVANLLGEGIGDQIMLLKFCVQRLRMMI